MTLEVQMPSQIFPQMVSVLAVLLLGTASIMPGIDRYSKRYFIAFYSILVIGGSFFTLDMLTYMKPAYIKYSNLFSAIECLNFGILFLLFNAYLMYSCGVNLKKSPLFHSTLLLGGLFCVLLVINRFTSLFFYSGSDGQFIVTARFPLLFIPLISMSIIDLVTLLRSRSRVSKNFFLASLIYMIIITAATIVHAFFFSLLLINAAFFIGSVLMYLLIMSEQISQYMHQEASIADNKANIMILQMRPHFIYNTMMSVYYLCEQDPKKAQQVILDFTSYLRKNFDAMASNLPIPFTEELEHIRAYLSVELVQFEDTLFVDYDTPHTQFRLPPLTLQPLVENAIKHGLDPDSDPLHIMIQTRETKNGSVIIVKDNGPGFDPETAFGSQNALSNIRDRLRLMCHGTISISSKIGEGTTVQLWIPWP